MRTTSRQSRSLLLWLVAILALSWIGVTGVNAPAQAADITCFVGDADTTYRVAPRDGVVRVDVDFTARNRCRDYALVGWFVGGIPGTARKFRVSGSGVSVKSSERDGEWMTYEVGFPRVLPGGRKRFRMTYEIPNGHPGRWHQVVLRDEYWHLCWSGHPAETGTTKVVFPGRRKPSTYLGTVKTRRDGNNVTVTAVRTRQPGTLGLCTDVFDRQRQVVSRVESDGGGSILIRGWASDPGWSTSVERSVSNVLPRLEAIFGTPISTRREIKVQQVAMRTLEGYAGTHYKGGYIRLAADSDDSQLVAHEIAHEWANERHFKPVWLQEGIADWAANQAAGRGVCTRPARYPGKSQPRLSKWVYLDERPTRRQEDIVDYQYTAACYVVTRIAWTIGRERMIEVIQALLQGRSPYDGSPWTRRQQRAPADWREWLDAVDELGLIAAGKEDLQYAERFVTEFGIADKKALRGRRAARADYHELVAQADGLQAPLVVRDHMDAWRFKDAREAIDLARGVAGAIGRLETCPGDDSTGSAAALTERYERAASVRALKRLRADVRKLASEDRPCEPAEVPLETELPPPSATERGATPEPVPAT